MTDKDLIDAARQAGCRVSHRQLERWRKAGLLPGARQFHVRGRRGSVTLSPPEVLNHLLALLRLRRQEGKLGGVAFRLWWEDYPVRRDRALGRYLRSVARDVRNLPSELKDKLANTLQKSQGSFEDDDEYEDGLKAAILGTAEELAKKPRSPLVRHVRRRVGRKEDDVVAVINLVFQTLLNVHPDWSYDPKNDESLQTIALRYLGLEPSDTNLKITPEAFGKISEVLSSERFAERVERGLGDQNFWEVLKRARNILRLLKKLLVIIYGSDVQIDIKAGGRAFLVLLLTASTATWCKDYAQQLELLNGIEQCLSSLCNFMVCVVEHSPQQRATLRDSELKWLLDQALSGEMGEDCRQAAEEFKRAGDQLMTLVEMAGRRKSGRAESGHGRGQRRR